MFTYILFSVFFTILYIWYQKRRKHFSLFRELGIPGPTPNIFFGNFLEIFLKKPIECQKEWIAKYGKVVGYFYGMSPVILITDTDLLKKIQIKDFQKFMDRAPLSNESKRPTTGRLSKHLLNLSGSKWKEIRSVITPSFTTSKMKMMSPTMNDAIKILLENFEKHCNSGEAFETYALFQRLTLDVITRTAFGIHTDIQRNSKDPIYKLFYLFFHAPFRFFMLLLTKSFEFIQPFIRLFRIVTGSIYNGGTNPVDELMNKCEIIVNSRKVDPKKRRPDFLQLLIDAEIKEESNIDYQTLAATDDAEKENNDAKEIKSAVTNSRPLTMDEMVGNAFVFLIAGFETTSTALAFCALMLVNFPEVQEKIRNEVNTLLEEGNQLDYVSVQKLQYLDQVFKEILRIYPPVYLLINREAAENVQYGKIFIPKGMAIQVPAYLLHRDPDYWEDPEEFRPERFAPENANKNNPIAWQPFGAGPRNCVGMRFAQMEAKLVLAQILHKYRLLPTEKTDKYPLELAITPNIIRPKNGSFVRLERC